MDPQIMYGNLCNFEETKILCKEITKDSFKEKPSALFSKKYIFIPYNNGDKSDNGDSEEEYYADLVSSASMIVKHYGKFDDKKFGAP